MACGPHASTVGGRAGQRLLPAPKQAASRQGRASQELGDQAVAAAGAVVGGELHLPAEGGELPFAEQELAAGGADQGGASQWRQLGRGVYQRRHAYPATYQDHLASGDSGQVEALPQRPEQLQLRALRHTAQGTCARPHHTRQEYAIVVRGGQEAERPRQEHSSAWNPNLCELPRTRTPSDLARSDSQQIVLWRHDSIRQHTAALL